MWFCIMGALLCSSPMSTATFQIPGPLLYAPPMRTWNYAWNYAAYWGVPILGPDNFTFMEQRGFTW